MIDGFNLESTLFFGAIAIMLVGMGWCLNEGLREKLKYDEGKK